MTYLYNNLFYGCNFLDFLFLKKNCCMHLLKSFYFLSIESLLCFYLQHSWLFLYSVRDENIFYFEKFENSFFVFSLL